MSSGAQMLPAPGSWPVAGVKTEFGAVADRLEAAAVDNEFRPDDFSREVYCLLGMPVDVIGMSQVLQRIRAAAARRAPFVLSTPNVNFLVSSRADPVFRESLLTSDLCTVDGTAIVWLARLLRIPIRHRVAGSDIFEALKSKTRSAHPLKVFLFGGAEGVAENASRALNDAAGGLHCVGTIYPGFGTVEEMSRDDMIEAINSSQADFLVASLSAKKGQLWLQKNHDRLRIPVRAHLGATINFQAGTIRRAPPVLRRLGIEWLWRIKEEPYLWKRYWHDAGTLLGLLATCVLPLAVKSLWQGLKKGHSGRDLLIMQFESHEHVTLALYGAATAQQVETAIPYVRSVVRANKQVVIDLSATHAIDARFLGLLLMLGKQLMKRGENLRLVGASVKLKRAICLHGADYLFT
jgi:N-acetylglucosaminyldiphosphoundecaprenol N-acetyl-beta-D-mannosaminyltransferase